MAPLWVKPGDLIFVRGKDWISKEIETITRSTYSHVAIVVDEGTIIEAQGFRKCSYNSIDEYRGMSDLYRCNSLTGNQRRKIVEAAKDHLGQRYDYLLIAVEYIRCALGIALPWYEGGRVICSTLVSDAYHAAGVDLTPHTLLPTPGDEALSPRLRKVVSF